MIPQRSSWRTTAASWRRSRRRSSARRTSPRWTRQTSRTRTTVPRSSRIRWVRAFHRARLHWGGAGQQPEPFRAQGRWRRRWPCTRRSRRSLTTPPRTSRCCRRSWRVRWAAANGGLHPEFDSQSFGMRRSYRSPPPKLVTAGLLFAHGVVPCPSVDQGKEIRALADEKEALLVKLAEKERNEASVSSPRLAETGVLAVP